MEAIWSACLRWPSRRVEDGEERKYQSTLTQSILRDLQCLTLPATSSPSPRSRSPQTIMSAACTPQRSPRSSSFADAGTGFLCSSISLPLTSSRPTESLFAGKSIMTTLPGRKEDAEAPEISSDGGFPCLFLNGAGS